jgi:hypothetical protein
MTSIATNEKVGQPVLNWASDNAFHIITSVALRVGSPRQAKAWTKKAARLWPDISSVEAAEAAIARLGGRGTCLTRSMAIAARCPEAFVVIGVWRGRTCGRVSSVPAHAWIEMRGAPLGSAEKGSWIELGRL